MLARLFENKEAAVFAAAASTFIGYKLSASDTRLVRAHSGTVPKDLADVSRMDHTPHQTGAKGRLQRLETTISEAGNEFTYPMRAQDGIKGTSMATHADARCVRAAVAGTASTSVVRYGIRTPTDYALRDHTSAATLFDEAMREATGVGSSFREADIGFFFSL